MYNFIDGDFFESICDYTYGDMYSENSHTPSSDNLSKIFEIHKNPIIFIETHRCFEIFNILINFPSNKCQIVCHNSDITFDERIISLIPNNVTKFWCQNYNGTNHHKIEPLPIGLERVRWFPEMKKQECLHAIMSENIKRDELVYMNFDVKTSPIRRLIYDQLKDKKFIKTEMIGNGSNYIDYLTNLKKHKFVISPPGNGVDCHRNWESLYCNCIPIIMKSNYTEWMFSELPVLLVDSYENLNEKTLHNFLESNKSDFPKDKLFKEYWFNKIKQSI